MRLLPSLEHACRRRQAFGFPLSPARPRGRRACRPHPGPAHRLRVDREREVRGLMPHLLHDGRRRPLRAHRAGSQTSGAASGASRCGSGSAPPLDEVLVGPLDGWGQHTPTEVVLGLAVVGRGGEDEGVEIVAATVGGEDRQLLTKTREHLDGAPPPRSCPCGRACGRRRGARRPIAGRTNSPIRSPASASVASAARRYTPVRSRSRSLAAASSASICSAESINVRVGFGTARRRRLPVAGLRPSSTP